MTKQEYYHVRALAWDLLIEAKISSMPVDINKIASLYSLNHIIKHSNSLYQNALLVSRHILKIFGLKTSPYFAKCLTVEILSPLIIIKQLDIKSGKDISLFSALPEHVSGVIFKYYKASLDRGTIGISNLELKILHQFKKWLNNKLEY